MCGEFTNMQGWVQEAERRGGKKFSRENGRVKIDIGNKGPMNDIREHECTHRRSKIRFVIVPILSVK